MYVAIPGGSAALRRWGGWRSSHVLRNFSSGKDAGSARFKGPPADSLSQEQAAIRDEILRSRPTTGLSGPFGPWLANAALADAAQSLGRVARYETSLDPSESELVILATAKHMRSPTEWAIHAKEAERVGLAHSAIASVERGDAELDSDEPDVLKRNRQLLLYATTKEMLETKRVSDASYSTFLKEFSEAQLVEVVAISGYYSLVALTLNVFEIKP